jgi:microcystin-dependent protein
MKIKIVVVDFEVPPRAKRWALRLGIPLAILGVAGIALAVPSLKQWKTGDTLTADDLNNSFQAVSVPPGTIVAWGGASDAPSIPVGWLLCDGSAVGRTGTYANLFTAISISFGGGDGVTTFNVPDLRGRFLRGLNLGAGRDPDVATRAVSNPGGNAGDKVGSLQDDQFRAHHHSLKEFGTFNVGTPFDTVVVGNGGLTQDTGGVIDTGGNETRPVNVAVNYIIKL